MSDIDILKIDENIKEIFYNEKANLPQYIERLNELKKLKKGEIRRSSIDFILHEQEQIDEEISDRISKNLQINIDRLSDKIKLIESDEEYNIYLVNTVNLIEKYKKILQTPIKVSFTTRKSSNNKEKKNIISSYINIAKKYTDINYNNKKENKRIVCNNCSNKNTFDVIDNSIYICVYCGSQQQIILNTSTYKDIDRINVSEQYTYDRKVHFSDCIKQYQGTQNCTIDRKVYKNLYIQFEKHHLLTPKINSNNEKVKKKERCKNITKEHIHLFLKELGYTKHYENVNLIHYKMTGKKPDNISYLEDKMIDDFDLLTETYDSMFKNKAGFERTNFLNSQYVLYQFLLRYKHKCKKSDFTILKTVDRMAFHDKIASQLFMALGWNFYELF